MPKRSPEDILADIEASEHEEAADRALSMTAAEREKELAAAGVTAAETDATGDEWRTRMERAAIDDERKRLEAEARDAAMRPSRGRRWPILLAAAAAIGALVAFVLFEGGSQAPPGPTAAPSTTPSVSTGMGVSPPPTLQAGVRDASPEASPDKPPVGPDKPARR